MKSSLSLICISFLITLFSTSCSSTSDIDLPLETDEAGVTHLPKSFPISLSFQDEQLGVILNAVAALYNLELALEPGSYLKNPTKLEAEDLNLNEIFERLLHPIGYEFQTIDRTIQVSKTPSK